MNILILGPDSRTKHIREFLQTRNHRLTVTAEPVGVEILQEREIEILISYGYAPVVKAPVTTVYRHKIINIHPAYLPEGRGIHTNFWAYFEGRPKGVSIHFIDDGIDTGDVIARREVPLADDETLRTSHARLDRAVEQLFFEVWDQIVEKTFQAVPQQQLTRRPHLIGKAEYRNRTESERLIELLPKRWDTPIKEVEAMGADFFLSAQFMERHDQEIKALP